LEDSRLRPGAAGLRRVKEVREPVAHLFQRLSSVFCIQMDVPTIASMIRFD